MYQFSNIKKVVHFLMVKYNVNLKWNFEIVDYKKYNFKISEKKDVSSVIFLKSKLHHYKRKKKGLSQIYAPSFENLILV